MNRTVQLDFADIVERVVALAIEYRLPIDDIITDPLGPCSYYAAGKLDLDAVYDACALAMGAHTSNQVGQHWDRRFPN